MQKISEILNSPTAPAETGARASSRPTTSDPGNWIWSNDERLAGRPGVPEPVPCEFCGALRYHKGIPLGNRILWPPYGAERCTCPEAVAAYEKEKAEREAAEAAAAKAEEEKKMRERIKRIVGESGMGDRFLRRTFSTFQLTDDNKRAAAAARRYAEGFDAMLPQPGRQEPGRNGLFIAGPPGTGKTHLAAAIANHLIAQGKPVICMTMIDLLERIKRTYSATGGSESDVLKIYKTVPLLVIDDIGKEPPTEWAISTVYNIINGRYEGGEILFDGEDLLKMSENQMREIRGNKIAMIFQEPMTSLNPVFTIGQQLMEAILLHEKATKQQAREKGIEMLKKVKIPLAEKRFDEYPHQLSGGMRQRVMIAMALCCNPQLLICDEPTTALDVTIQAQILDLINELKEETGTSVMMITHDLGVIAEVADDVMVMYAGKVVEHATCDQIFDEPLHPYTSGLMSCIPRLDGDDTKELSVIEGMVPSYDDMPEGCAFCPRCPYAKEICRKQMPELEEVKGRRVRCFRYTKEWEESAK